MVFTAYLFFKGAQAGGRTWDLLVFVYFLSLKQRLRPLGYCAPHLLLTFVVCQKDDTLLPSPYVSFSRLRLTLKLRELTNKTLMDFFSEQGLEHQLQDPRGRSFVAGQTDATWRQAEEGTHLYPEEKVLQEVTLIKNLL